jgi:transposase
MPLGGTSQPQKRSGFEYARRTEKRLTAGAAILIVATSGRGAAAFRSNACGIGQFMGSKVRVNRPQAARLHFASSLSCVSPR